MKDKYYSESQQRILNVLQALAGHEVEGLSPTALSKGLKANPAAITRALANLKINGLADSIPDSNNWRLLPKIVQISFAHSQEINKQMGKLDEMHQRYTRTPN